ncbi:hypothetical protein ANN_03995 [Periplaneta americana]|uniref:DUF4371 domain-containing protein n=1 Tax=Periplaneta americana TaxID=6978 RepID=A0ABQ8T7C4_PERAM|nr:hypothetical protein ANN_03995 [Periplaneta americana]
MAVVHVTTERLASPWLGESVDQCCQHTNFGNTGVDGYIARNNAVCARQVTRRVSIGSTRRECGGSIIKRIGDSRVQNLEMELIASESRFFKGADHASLLRLHRTNVVLIRNILFQHFKSELKSDIDSGHFSLLIDESTDISVIKLLAVCIAYYSKQQHTIVSTFLGIVELENRKCRLYCITRRIVVPGYRGDLLTVEVRKYKSPNIYLDHEVEILLTDLKKDNKISPDNEKVFRNRYSASSYDVRVMERERDLRRRVFRRIPAN